MTPPMSNNPIALDASRTRPALPPRPVFTEGSTRRHVAVMTATGSIGLMAIFVVDLLSLFYVSRLGDQSAKAAVGYASQVLFLAMSINIGLTIAASAVVSRVIGSGDRPRARHIAASSLLISALVSAVLAAVLWVYREPVLDIGLNAHGRARDIAVTYLSITLPGNLPMAVGMVLAGLLRADGDAKRAMYVTLAGGIVTAFVDPLLIFGAGLGVYGAAWATDVARLVFVGVGLWGTIWVHDLVAWPKIRAVFTDAVPIFSVGLPAILANLATPVSAVYTTRVFSDFGESAIAASAIIDRVVPVAFGVIFALTGSVGPVLGQNYGARLFHRVRGVLTEALVLCGGYVLAAWAVLFLLSPYLLVAFDAHGDSARIVTFFCAWGVTAWIFIGALFVANTAFNNLGFPLLSTAFNWGRATLGTIPFVTVGARLYGVEGGMMGIALGAALFGLAAVLVAYVAVDRLAKRMKPA
jgi:putative MATE family efflux protein